MTATTHAEPCGCVYEQIDVPDDQGDGQGWVIVTRCYAHEFVAQWQRDIDAEGSE